jgi:hypothetical protein
MKTGPGEMLMRKMQFQNNFPHFGELPGTYSKLKISSGFLKSYVRKSLIVYLFGAALNKP